MLDECLEYFAQRKNASPNFTYEIIVVSDGSTDKTVELAHSYARQYSTNIIRVLELQPNRGKGGAVKMVRWKLKKLCLGRKLTKQKFSGGTMH